MDYSSYNFLRVEVDDGVASITINRPQKANSCRREDHGEFAQILRDIAVDDSVRSAIITGAGATFSVGADYDWLESLVEDPEQMVELHDQILELVHAHVDLDKPIVAAINGVATGSGLMFALLCDFILIEEHVRFADGHIRLAIAAGDGGAMIWPLAAGITQAKRYLLTGDWIGAHEAARIGLVTEVVPEGTSLERGMAVARRFADGPQLAVRMTKKALNQWLRFGSSVAFDQSAALEMLTFALCGADVRESVAKLRQGRGLET